MTPFEWITASVAIGGLAVNVIQTIYHIWKEKSKNARIGEAQITRGTDEEE